MLPPVYYANDFEDFPEKTFAFACYMEKTSKKLLTIGIKDDIIVQ